MKNIIKQCWNSNYCKIILATLLTTITLPLVFSTLRLGKPMRVGVLFLALNLTIAAIFGHWIKKTKQPKWTFLILPAAFLLLILLNYLSSAYVYLLLILYLLVEYLFYLLTDAK